MDRGLLFAIISPLFSSIATIFKVGAAKVLTPLPVIGIGGALGSIILYVVAKLKREEISLKKFSSHQKELFILILLRFILGELSFTYGLSQTSAIKAIFFTKVEPYFVIFLGWVFLRQRVELRHLILLFIHLTGAVLLSTGGNFHIIGKAQLGDILIIVAMMLFASSYHYGKRLAKSVGSISVNAVAMGIASLFVIPFMFAFTDFTKLNFLSTGWLYLLLYVLLFNVIALTFWFASLKTVKGWMVSALRYIGPVLGAPIAYFLFGDTLNFVQVAGATIVLATSFLIARDHLSSH